MSKTGNSMTDITVNEKEKLLRRKGTSDDNEPPPKKNVSLFIKSCLSVKWKSI